MLGSYILFTSKDIDNGPNLLILTMVFATENNFIHVARPILDRKPKGATSNRDFISMFGVTPQICAKVWNLLAAHDHPPPNNDKNKYLFKHLLWGLMFLKIYATRAILVQLAGVCKETFMKWAWITVKKIASLKSKVV